MMRTTRSRLLTGALLLLPTMAVALETPRTGQTMEQVRKTLGAPAHELDSVGSPAITRWVYDGLTVYFENRQVLHAVRTQPLPEPLPVSAPEPAVTRSTTPLLPSPPPQQAPVKPAREVAPATPPAATSGPAMPAAPSPIASPTPAAGTPPPRIGGSGFYFDPDTGRLILQEENPAASAPAPEPSASPGTDDAPSSSLTFDPETGTFR